MNEPIEKETSNINSEYAVIGWVLSDVGILANMSDLRPNHFHSLQHAQIWQAIESLYAKDEPITPFSIAPLVDVSIFGGQGEAIKYMTGSLVSTINNPFPLGHKKHIIQLAQLREVENACKAASGKSDATEAMRIMQESIDHIRAGAQTQEFQDSLEVTNSILKALADNKAPDSTGLPRLDEAMGGGLYAGKCYGFAARKKMGKTTLAGTISHNLNMGGVKHLFICGEMSPEEIQQRILSRALNVYASAFRNEYGKKTDFSERIANYAAHAPRNALFKNAPGLTFDQLKEIYQTAIDKHGVKGVILDYWQLVGGKDSRQSDAAHLDAVAQWIADYSRKRGIWTIAMAQINQEGNTRGGEGLRLAFDQVYQLKALEDDPSSSGRYLEMMDTRYTKWGNIGSENRDGYRFDEKGTYFEEMPN
jgi:replicative DNA helicase